MNPKQMTKTPRAVMLDPSEVIFIAMLVGEFCEMLIEENPPGLDNWNPQDRKMFANSRALLKKLGDVAHGEGA